MEAIDVLRAIDRALQDHTAAEVLDENSPLRDAMRSALAATPVAAQPCSGDVDLCAREECRYSCAEAAAVEPAAQSDLTTEGASSTGAKTEGGKLYEIDRKRSEQHQRQLRAAVEPAKVPEGWKLVPIEPTVEMKIAGDNAGFFWCGDKYRAMLNAAPTPPEQASPDCCPHGIHYDNACGACVPPRGTK